MSNIHAGLANFEILGDAYDLGDGIKLLKTYAQLMSPFLVSTTRRTQEKPFGTPWIAAQGGNSFDITAELFVPSEATGGNQDRALELATTILFLLRLGINPAVTMPAVSQRSFSELSQIPEPKPIIFPVEVQPMYFALRVDEGSCTNESVAWIRDRWKPTQKLIDESPDFSLAVAAIHNGQFVRESQLAMVSLWAAIEALFSPSKTELAFRVSSLIAAFLEPPGKDRALLQKEIAKLYSKRSAAAHGKPNHSNDDLLQTFTILRNVLLKIIDRGSVPTKESLEGMLFGAVDEQEALKRG